MENTANQMYTNDSLYKSKFNNMRKYSNEQEKQWFGHNIGIIVQPVKENEIRSLQIYFSLENNIIIITIVGITLLYR